MIVTDGQSYGDRLDQVSQARRQGIQTLFDAELFTLSSLMGPMNDGPEWPSDAAWLALQHKDCACLVSDGLSDPWVEAGRPSNGLGLEVFIETPQLRVEQDNPMVISDRWLFPMTAEISHTLASYPRLSAKLVAAEVLSVRLNIDHLKDGLGLRTLLLQPVTELDGISTSTLDFALVAATLLTMDEGRWLAGKGEAGRLQLQRLLNEQGTGIRSDLQRASVV